MNFKNLSIAKSILSCVFVMIQLAAFAQNAFEKGQIILEDGTQLDCYIMNEDWKNNPERLDYRLGQDGKAQTIAMTGIRAFSIPNKFKFVKATVPIERSSNVVREMDYNKNPKFTEEEVLLKVLVEGKASLYFYEQGNVANFFMSKDQGPVTPLVYKRYLVSYDKVGSYEQYKQDLINALQCESIRRSDILKVSYKRSSLMKLFSNYNNCSGEQTSNYEKPEKKGSIHLQVKVGANQSSLELENTYLADTYKLDPKTGIQAGVELEYVLPFNNGKWAITAEPMYRGYRAETTQENRYVSGGTATVVTDYKSVDLGFSVKHYFFTGPHSAIFIQGGVIPNISFSPSIDFYRNDGVLYRSLDLDASMNYALGAGYTFHKKLSLELRYQTKRELLSSYPNWNGELKSVSLILGYRIF